MRHYIVALKKYFDFKGKASRKEFWLFFLFHLIFFIATKDLDDYLGLGKFSGLNSVYIFVTFIPFLAIISRRLHDTGKSSLLMLLILIPVIGFIVLLILLVMAGKPTNENMPLSSEVKDIIDTSHRQLSSETYYHEFNTNSFVLQREDDMFNVNCNYEVFKPNKKELVLKCLERGIRQPLKSIEVYQS